MRISGTTVAIVLAGAGAANLAAALDTTGSNIALNGSDTLFDVTQSVMASCNTAFADFSAQGITYLGGGSGVGAGQMWGNLQQVSPMSRPLKSSEYCSVISPASPNLAEALLVGIESVAIAANQTSSCSDSVGGANGFGSASTMSVLSGGTGAATGATYTFGDPAGALYRNQPSFDALAVLYFGLTHDGTYDCASDIRKSLVRNWNNVFTRDCPVGNATCSSGLTHAWRRSDLSGTTDALVSILNPPGKGIGTPSNVPVSAARKSNPFCNSPDANTTPATVSFGGSSDFSDADPVRTNCVAGKDGVCEGFKFGAPSGLFAGDLGVVQVILVPDAATTQTSDLYPLPPCGASCTFVTPIKGNQVPLHPCPGGNTSVVGGGCLMPFAGSPSSPDPRCVAGPATKCADQLGKPDGRRYNLVTVVPATQIRQAQRGTTPFQFALDANNRLMIGSFYRIHSTTAGAGSVPDPATGQTGLCRESNDTSQIGCLVDSDPCSVGYAGRDAAKAYPGLGIPSIPTAEPLKALAIDGTPPFTPASVSPDPNLALENLLQPAGTTPFYALARRLSVDTIYGFGNLKGGESELAQCYANNAIVGPAMASHGFVPVPGGVQCLDYPEELGTISAPAPNVQGTGNVELGGCNLGLIGQNACTASPPSITN